MDVEQLEDRRLFSVGGVLDTLFGTHQITQPFAGVSLSENVGETCFVSDSSLLLVSGIAGHVVKFDSSGQRDMTFGTQGVVSTGITTPTFVHELSDGSIMVGGRATQSQFSGSSLVSVATHAGELSPSSVIITDPTPPDPIVVTPTLVRFSADGKLLPGFEEAHGDTRTVTFSEDAQRSNVIDVELQSDGKVLVLCQGTLFRLNADGTRDLGFGTAATHVASALIDQPVAMHVRSDGKIMIVGDGGTNGGIAIARLNENGDRDATFGSNGAVGQIAYSGPIETVDGPAYEAEFLPDGRLLVLGDRPNGLSDGAMEPSALMFRSDGSLDPGFGIAGSASLPDITLDVLEYLPDGRILIGGADRVNALGASTTVDLIRLLANGSRDPGFGEDGVLPVQFSPGPQPNRIKSVYVGDTAYTLYGETDVTQNYVTVETTSVLQRYSAGPSAPMADSNEAPDLVGRITGRVPKRVAAGQALNLSFEVKNQGSVKASGVVDLLVTLSHNARVGFPLGTSAEQDDQLAGRLDDVPISLSPGAHRTFKVRVVAPAAAWDGPLLFAGYVDAGSEISESNEVNNHAVGPAVPMPMGTSYEMEISAPAALKQGKTASATVRFRNLSSATLSSTLAIRIREWDASTGEYDPVVAPFTLGVNLKSGAVKSFKVKLQRPLNLTEFYLVASAARANALDTPLARVTSQLTRVL